MVFDPEKITFFAQADARGKNTPFGIKAIDRQRHMYVIGKTGMGKSTLLENMAVQDIQSGEGCAFIDPHGSTAETLLNYVPESRQEDVLYFAPFDMEHPISFNVMEDVGVDKRHLVVSGLMSVFEKIWVDAWSARMAYILQNTIQALLEYPDSTLLGINRMLSDKDYRRLVIDNIEDPSVKSFWVDEFLKYNERYMQEAGDAIKNKIGQFTANPLIRNIIGQPKSSFDIREMMDQKKIIIMNLSKGLVGETNANLLGSMLTTRIYLAAMSRADCNLEATQQLPNFYFYVDEFQSFANATFANILSEARKYKLNLTIAHQYIEQMEEEVKNAVFGNVGTIVSFRAGPFDAEVLESIFNPQFYAIDICNLGFAQIYLTLMIDGIGSKPFSAITMSPIKPAEISYKDCIIAASRRNYGRPRAEVEEMVKEFHRPVKSGGGSQASGQLAERNNSVKKNNLPSPNRSDNRRQVLNNNGNNGKSGGYSGNQNGGGNNGNRKQNESPRPDNERKGKRPANNKPVVTKRDVRDLKSVLAKIAKAEDLKGKPETKTVAKTNPEEKPNRPGGAKKPALDLGSAVSATLAKHVATEASPPPVKTPPPAKNSSEKVPSLKASESLDAERNAAEWPTPQPPKKEQTAPEPSRPKEITPQELKRRLRVPESERPPLRR